MDTTGAYNTLHGKAVYQKAVADEDVIFTFIRKESYTSEDLLEASMVTGQGMVFNWKDLQSSTILRIKDTVAELYGIDRNTVGEITGSLNNDYLLTGHHHEEHSSKKETSNASYRVSAARQLLSVAILSDSAGDINSAKFLMAAVYTTAWGLDEDTAVKCADRDIELLKPHIDQIEIPEQKKELFAEKLRPGNGGDSTLEMRAR